jgi:SAM-dependent methyltransferase
MDKFAFGENWHKYSREIKPDDFVAAKESLFKLVPYIENKSFIDIGCGSGLFSIAASALGAREVVGIDVDPESVATAKELLGKILQWDPAIKQESIFFSEDSILNDKLQASRYHTGDMYQAFANIATLVSEKGHLVIAIYNKHFTSPIWKTIKFTYVKSPIFIQKLLVFVIAAFKLFVTILTGRNPFKKMRGMHFYSDIVDWVGGYPYEYASIEEVCRYFEANGFKTEKVNKTLGFTGCNEFVFNRIK